MDSYRTEIIETQQARSDLLKWKLVLIAVLGSIGLGLKGTSDSTSSDYWLNSHVYLILCLIPFVCTYVDLLCYHLNLRILVIGSFLQDPRRSNIIRKNIRQNDLNQSNDSASNLIEYESDRLYERICEDERDVFELESFALKSSSVFISLILIALPFVIELDHKDPNLDDFSLIVSGFFGVMIAMYINFSFKRKSEAISKASQGEQKNLKLLETFNLLYKQVLYQMYSNTFLMFSLSIFYFINYYYLDSALAHHQANISIISPVAFLVCNILVLIVIGLLVWCFIYTRIQSIKEEIEEIENINQADKSQEQSEDLNKCIIGRTYYFLIDKRTRFGIIENLKKTNDFIHKTWLFAVGFTVIAVLLVLILAYEYHQRVQVKTLDSTIYNLFNYFSHSFLIIGLIVVLLIPIFNHYFIYYLARLSTITGVIPKEIGKIKAHYYTEISKSDPNSKSMKLDVDGKTIFNKIDIEESLPKTTDQAYLVVIKCSKGMIVANPGKYSINIKHASIDNEDLPATGTYWETKYNFQMKFVFSDNSSACEFKEWKKTFSKDSSTDEDGIEIGDETALFFVYMD